MPPHTAVVHEPVLLIYVLPGQDIGFGTDNLPLCHNGLWVGRHLV